MGLPDALSGRPGGGGMGLPDALSGGRGGRVAPGFGPTGGPVRVGAGRGGATEPDATAAAAAAASRSIEGVAVRGGNAAATSGGGIRVEAAAMRCEEMTLVATGALDAAGTGTCWGVGAVGAARAVGASSWWSGETGRRSPSASALRRTRSAWASSIDEEWLFTPMPSEMERSKASLLVRPSSLASS
jgi:hypothetical protein